MPQKIESFRPYCQVILKHREDDADGNPRPPVNIDITKHLADTGSIHVTRTLDCISQFSIQLQDIPLNFFTEDSLYGFVEIMDVIVVYLAREKIDTGPKIPVIRGYVRDVRRSESISEDGRPVRIIQISGMCLGCAFVIQQLGALEAMMKGTNVLPWLAYIDNVNLRPQLMPDWQFMQDSIANIKDMLKSAGYTMEFETDTQGDDTYVTPLSLDKEIGPIWDLMVDNADMPFHELFVKQNDKNPVLVYRKTPWLVDPLAAPSQYKTVGMHELIAVDSHRSDAHLANGCLYELANYILGASHFNITLGQRTFVFEGPQNRADIIGARIIQQAGKQLRMPGHNLPEAEQLRSEITNFDFIEVRRKQLMDWMQRNADLEDGSMVIRGRDDIIPGEYIQLSRGDLSYYAYVVAVWHEFVPYHRYTTTLQFIRSGGYIRRKQVQNPWQAERKVTAIGG